MPYFPKRPTSSPLTVSALCLAFMLVGCGEKAAQNSQVLATVNGEEITERDLRAELAASQMKASEQDPNIKKRLIEAIIDRKLINEAAKESGIEDSPDYLIAVRRAKEEAMAAQLIKQWSAVQADPSTQAIDKFILENPQMFARRASLLVDRITTPKAGLDMNKLGKAVTQEDIVKELQRLKKPFTRDRIVVDTAAIPPQLAAQIEGLKSSEPFIFASGADVVSNVILQKKDNAVPDASRRALAKSALQKIDLEKSVKDEIAQRRKSADIQYRSAS